MKAENIRNLINVLHVPHTDNAKLQYYAKTLDNRSYSIMPHTSFVYELFIFNSLYQRVWENTKESDKFKYHSQWSVREFEKQKIFISYLENRIKEHPEYICKAFEPLLYSETDGSWARIRPDARITEKEGEDFFRCIDEFKNILYEPEELNIDKIFDIIKQCLKFIYLVRNNIFHGSKKLGDIFESDQKKRIDIYDLFLKGVTSLFFLAAGKHEAACDYVPCSLKNMDRQAILEAVGKKMMKIADARLVAQFLRQYPLPSNPNNLSERASLFYPGAGRDFVTPVLLGLPYCTQFYFFERSPVSSYKGNPPEALRSLCYILQKNINGVDIQLDPPRNPWYTKEDDADCLDFKYKGVPRRIHWIHADNKEIFKKDIELQFYFHRCDSQGEVASDQRWDSVSLLELCKLIPSGSSALFVTDGFPYGFNKSSEGISETHKLTTPFINRSQIYYCGKLSSTRS